MGYADQPGMVAAVQRWLAANDGWLLVLDNGDRPELAAEFLPDTGRGHVLLTGRPPHLEELRIFTRLELNELLLEEALAFLAQRNHRPERETGELDGAVGDGDGGGGEGDAGGWALPDAVILTESTVGPGHPVIGARLGNLALILSQLGRPNPDIS